jgi:hypothetical protein
VDGSTHDGRRVIGMGDQHDLRLRRPEVLERPSAIVA